MTRYRSTTELRYRAAVLVLVAVVAIGVALWLTSGQGNPVDVLGCVWDRASADATATTAAECG